MFYKKIYFEPAPAAIQSMFAGIRPRNTTIFTDLTGTLVEHTDTGFPEEHQENLKYFIEHNGQLIIVTGDSRTSIEDHFFGRLNYTGSRPIYCAILGGYELYAYQNQTLRLLDQQNIQPYSASFQNHITTVFAKALQRTFSINADALQNSLLPCGHKTIIQDMINSSDKAFIEIYPTKVTIAFPGAPNTTDHEQQQRRQTLDLIEQELKKDLQVKAQNAKIMRGEKFVDVILTTKDDGVRLAYESLLTLEPRRNIILMGDSENDVALFNYNYPADAQVTGLFFGNDTRAFEKIQNTSRADYQLHFWQGQFTQGSQTVLREITRTKP